MSPFPDSFASHPEADDEVFAALRYYRNVSPLTATRFVDELEVFLSRINDNPLRYHPAHSHYRRCNFKRFQHAIIYRQKGESIYVIALIHVKQRPFYWLHRIHDDTD